MAWTAGVTRTTGDLITAANWNSYLGAAGSLDYLKSAADTNASDITTIENQLDDCSSSAPSRALDTIYQNGSKTRIVTAGISLDDGEAVRIDIGSDSPPATAVCGIDTGSGSGVSGLSMPITFIIPANWYYRILIATGTPVKQYWHEWDLL